MGDTKRSGSYPIQSSEYVPHTEPPPASLEESKSPLPGSVRALKDSRQSSRPGRTVVICLDGTGDRFDNDNSNVVHFVSCLRKHEPSHQVTYYQSGIGTYDKGGLKSGFKAAMDMAVGSGLGIHIKDAYRFLMQNYRDGDRICLIGFSRGAYTVRCLAGMLHKVGLLPASNGAQVNFAYDFYKDDSPEGWKMSAEFKKTFCTNVNVYFVGLWDCVASVGFIPRKLPFSKSPTNSVHYFRHAMALDEHRSKFKVCQWQHQNPDIQRRNTIDQTPGAQMRRGMKRSGILNCFGLKEKMTKAKSSTTRPDEKMKLSDDTSHSHGSGSASTSPQDKLESYFETLDVTRKRHHKIPTDALEVWFMGAHADVGGGAVANEERHKLSHVPLRWMLRQCFACDTGILFDTASLAEQGLDVHSLWPVYGPRTVPSFGPPPALMEIYESGKYPSLQLRSALHCIASSDSDEDTVRQSSGDPPHPSPPVKDNRNHQLALLSESNEDHFDALSPINDQLVEAKGWWILELWPVKIRVLARGGEGWEKRVRLNMGRYRAVRHIEPNMHWTVRRMVEEGRYTVKGGWIVTPVGRSSHRCKVGIVSQGVSNLRKLTFEAQITWLGHMQRQ